MGRFIVERGPSIQKISQLSVSTREPGCDSPNGVLALSAGAAAGVQVLQRAHVAHELSGAGSNYKLVLERP